MLDDLQQTISLNMRGAGHDCRIERPPRCRSLQHIPTDGCAKAPCVVAHSRIVPRTQHDCFNTVRQSTYIQLRPRKSGTVPENLNLETTLLPSRLSPPSTALTGVIAANSCFTPPPLRCCSCCRSFSRSRFTCAGEGGSCALPSRVVDKKRGAHADRGMGVFGANADMALTALIPV
jgi:hypothetical protein